MSTELLTTLPPVQSAVTLVGGGLALIGFLYSCFKGYTLLQERHHRKMATVKEELKRGHKEGFLVTYENQRSIQTETVRLIAPDHRLLMELSKNETGVHTLVDSKVKDLKQAGFPLLAKLQKKDRFHALQNADDTIHNAAPRASAVPAPA